MPTARLLIAAILLAFFATPVMATSLTPHSAVYKVKISVISGRLDTQLLRTETGYTATHVIQPTGLSKLIAHGEMNVRSEFRADADGIKPVHYNSVDTISDDPDVDVSFDWSNNTVAGTIGDNVFEQQLESLSFDNVSIQYRLMEDLLNGTPGETYVLFDVDKLRIATISYVGEKQIRTKAGEFTAVGVRHQKEGSSRVTTLWCVEKLGYLPAVIEQHRKGKLNFRATLVDYTPTPE